jgi:hypothetical protein
MALPNLNAPTKVEGKNAVQAVGTSATAIVSNSAASGKSYRVVGLWVANVDGSSACDLTVDVYDGTTARKMASTVSVPADATLEVIGQRPLYLLEGDSLRLTASASGDLEAVCSFEEIS